MNPVISNWVVLFVGYWWGGGWDHTCKCSGTIPGSVFMSHHWYYTKCLGIKPEAATLKTSILVPLLSLQHPVVYNC